MDYLKHLRPAQPTNIVDVECISIEQIGHIPPIKQSLWDRFLNYLGLKKQPPPANVYKLTLKQKVSYLTFGDMVQSDFGERMLVMDVFYNDAICVFHGDKEPQPPKQVIVFYNGYKTDN